MLKQDLITNAIRRARLNVNDPKIIQNAEHALELGIKKFSSDSTITAFQRIARNITIGNTDEGTTIGKPLERRGYYIFKSDVLPSLSNYDPEDAFLVDDVPIIMGRTYVYYNNGFYGVHSTGEGTEVTYHWQEEAPALWNSFLQQKPDVVVWDMESIIGIVGKECKLDKMSPMDYEVCNHREHSYYEMSLGNGLIKIVGNEANPVTIIYIPEINVNGWEQIELTYQMQVILECYIAEEVARTAELKQELSDKLVGAISNATTMNLDFTGWKWGR